MVVRRRKLIKQLKKIAKSTGEEYREREGGNHTVINIGTKTTAVLLHSEIFEHLAKVIRKQVKGENSK